MIGRLRPAILRFHYYGTVGSNRDEFVIVQKLEKVDWMEGPHREAAAQKEAAE